MKKYIFFAVLFYFINTAQAQGTADTDTGLPPVPPLQTLIDSAILRSPLLKSKTTEVRIAEKEIKTTKRSWTDYVFIEGSVNYGQYDQIVLSGTSLDEQYNSGLLTKGEQLRYYGGVGVKLPLSSIINRRNRIQINQLQVQKAEFETVEAEDQIRQIIIDEFYLLKYAEESLQTFTDIYQTLQISYTNAQNEVKSGKMNLNDFALLVSTVGKAKDSFIKAKNNYYAQYKRLEELTGIKF